MEMYASLTSINQNMGGYHMSNDYYLNSNLVRKDRPSICDHNQAMEDSKYLN